MTYPRTAVFLLVRGSMRRTSTITLILAAVISTALLVPMGAAAAVRPMTLSELCAESDAIVEATVVGRSSRQAGVADSRGQNRNPIKTAHNLKIGRVLKGERASTFELLLPGGTVGDLTMVVSEVPELAAAGRYLLFLDENGIVGGPQGSMEIVSGRVPALGLSLHEAVRAIQAIDQPVLGPAPDIDIAAIQALASTSLAEQPGAIAALAGISSISPGSADAGIGQQVTISGSGFGSTRGGVSFLHGASVSGDRVQATSIVSWTDSQVVVEVPRRAQGGSVHVTTAGGTTYQSPSFDIGFSGSGLTFPAYPVNYYINENTGDMTGEGSQVRAALATWNESGSNFRVAYAGTSAMASADPDFDGRNDIGFASSGFLSGVLAWNVLWYHGDSFIESNIAFNDAAPWGNGASNSFYDLQSIALHEMGHSVGLDDQYMDLSEVMGALPLNTTRRTLTQAEIRGSKWANGVPSVTVTATPAVWFDTISDSKLLLHWKPAPSPDVTAYRLYERDQFIGEIPAESAWLSGLSAGTSYRFSVSGVDEFGRAVAFYPVFAVTMPSSSGVAQLTSLTTSATVSVPAALGFSVAQVGVAFDSIGTDGALKVVRTPTLPAPFADARALTPGWGLLFDGAHTGSVSVTVPVDPRLPEWRRAGLTAACFDGGQWASVPSAFDSPTASVSLTLPGTVPFVLAENPDVDSSTSLGLDTTGSALAPDYGRSARISVRLTDVTGYPLAGRAVSLHTGAGSRISAFSEVPGASGTYSAVAPLVRSKTTFSVRFADDAINSASSIAVGVTPKVALSISAPTYVRRYRRFVVGGSIKPAHGSASVKIQAAKKGSDGVYRVSKTFWSTTSTTTVRKTVSLGPGRWRLRLLHADWAHASSTSRWTYLTVK